MRSHIRVGTTWHLIPLLMTAMLCACSTTEQQVQTQIEILAANEIGSDAWRGAVDELVDIGRPSARQLLVLLDPAQYRGAKYREFRDEITKTRTGAAVVLGRIGHKAASASVDDRIVKTYKLPERKASIHALGELGWTQVAVTALKLQVADSANAHIRLLSAVALLKMDEKIAVDTIRAAVSGTDAELAGLAATELEGANYFGVPLLVELSARPGPNQDRLRLAMQTIKGQLIDQLGDDDPEVRGNSASALGTIGDADAVPALLEILGDASNLVRFNAASSLSQLGSPRGTEFLFEALRDTDPILRVNSIRSLVQVQRASAAVEERLLAALGDEEPLMRSGAAQILGEAAVVGAVDELVAAVDDTVSEVRCNAVIALGRIRALASRPMLEKLLDDDDVTVAYYAEWALGQIGEGT